MEPKTRDSQLFQSDTSLFFEENFYDRQQYHINFFLNNKKIISPRS